MHFLKFIKIGEFLCRHVNIEDGRRYTTFLVYCALYFKTGKNTTEMQKKKICAVAGEGAVTDQTCQTCCATFLGTNDILAK